MSVLWLLSTAPLDRREGERASEIGTKCNKGAVNRLGLRVKKENERWPMRWEETGNTLAEEERKW